MSGWVRLVLPSLVVAVSGLALAAATARSMSGPGVLLFSLGIAAVTVAIPMQLGMLLAYLPAIGLALAARFRFAYVATIREFDERAERFARSRESSARERASISCGGAV